jgi:hypothetical protein
MAKAETIAAKLEEATRTEGWIRIAAVHAHARKGVLAEAAFAKATAMAKPPRYWEVEELAQAMPRAARSSAR